MCQACGERKLESVWEHPAKLSFCPACGTRGVEIVAWGCDQCREEWVRFEAPAEPPAACPECGEPALRILEAPMVVTDRKRFDTLDKTIEQVMDRKSPVPNVKGYAASWVNNQMAQSVTPDRTGTQTMLGLPKPSVQQISQK